METFFTQVKVIRDKTREIDALLPSVAKRHEAVLVAYTQEQIAAAQANVDQVMAKISSVANEVRTLLKRMDTTNKAAKTPDSDVGSADLRIRESQQTMLTKKFVGVMTEYNDIQAANKRKYRDMIKRQCQVVDPTISDQVVDNLIETGTTSDIFKGMRLDEASQALDQIKDRHADILKLEQSLMQLHEMFLDMALLVSEQGDMIDRIENSVGKASDYVHKAKKKLDRALELQSAARKKKMCCFIALLILVAVIIGAAMLD